MRKKIYFTQKQLNEILGEDFMSGGAYLDKTSTGTEYDKDSIPATDSEVVPTEGGGEPETLDRYGREKTPNNMWTRRGAGYSLYENSKKKVRKNDEGRIVPETCPKCGSKVGLYIQGEPIYRCSNKKCRKYFGIMPFPNHSDKETAKLNERNSELDGKKIFSLPQEVRAYANQDGQHNEIMSRLQSGEKMDLPSLYRLRNELQDSPNKKVTNAVNRTIDRAKKQGAALRDTHSNTIDSGLNNPKTGTPGKGHRKNTPTIYYENN